MSTAEVKPMMSDDERRAWGASEREARKADIAAVKAGDMTLEQAQANARRRSRQSGMSPTESYRAMRSARLS